MRRPAKIEDELRRALVRSGRSHNQLAQLAGLETSAVNRFIRGKRGLAVGNFARVARTIGLELKLERRETD